MTWLLDDAFYKKSTSKPHSMTVSTTPGLHKLKARWIKNTAGDTDFVQANFNVGPYLAVSGAPLEGGDVTSPMTVSLENASIVNGAVTWLVDDRFAGKDAAAPYTWDLAAPRGNHKIKARWTLADASTVEVSSKFTVQTDLDWKAPEEVREEPGPALQNLWVSSDNRRAALPGVYDWSKAGFGGGTVLPNDSNVRPDATCQITADQMSSVYGVVPNDTGDDTNGIQAAIDHIKSECSPTGEYTKMSRILLPAGTLKVTHEIHVDADYLIIRGAATDGANRTLLEYAPDANTRYDKITKDGTRWDLEAMGDGEANGGWLWPGRGLFRVQTRQVAPKYAEAYAAAPANRKDLYEGTINDHWTTGLTLRGKPGDTNYAGRKGDKTLYLATGSSFDNLKVGGLVNVMAANTTKFYDSMKALPTEYPLDNLYMRQQIFMVTAGDPFGKTITLDKPLEYDVPVTSVSDGSAPIDGKTINSKVSPLVDAVVGVGFENLSLTQQEPGLDKSKATDNYGNMDPAGAMHGIVFKWAANSWVKGISTEMTGSHPIVTEDASNLSIVDNHLDGSWNKGKGGNGYFRGSRVWDSLYAGNTMRNLRHFTFQWSASGNVAIGNSSDADLNLHGGYERNNLFERNEVSTPYSHRPDNCWTNCGGEGADGVDDADWYPVWWAAGKKAVKWSGSSGPNNVFFNNFFRKQLDSGTAPYDDYDQFGQGGRIYQVGTDASGDFHHLDVDGQAISDWSPNENRDFADGHGVIVREDQGQSLFLDTVALNGYGGPHPQPLRRTWGCSCWDGRGMVNTRLAADPINTATGSLMENFSDLNLSGVGENLSWGRTYNSSDPTDGPLGTGWTFSYNPSLLHDPDGFYYFREATGSQAQFERSPNGTYVAKDPGVTATLSDTPGGGWTITSQSGQQISFDTAGRATTIRDNRGLGVSLTYSGGKLTKVSDALGQSLTVSWTPDSPSRISDVTSSDGRSVHYGYASTAGGNRLVSITGVDGKRTKLTYDDATGLLNSITDPAGNISARTVYDPTTRRAVSQKDADGRETTFDWDADLQVATITDPAGAVRRDYYDHNVLIGQTDSTGRTSSISYNAANHPTAEVGSDQQTVSSVYDDRGRLTARTAPLGNGATATENWVYDSNGHLTSHENALGQATTWAYDADGNEVSETDPSGGVTRWTYNALGLPVTETNPLGKVTTSTYNAAGDLVAVTEPGGARTEYSYDAQHRKTSETDPRGTAPTASTVERAKYTKHWTYDDNGNVLTYTDAIGRMTTNAYDDIGRLTSTTAPNGAVTSYTYDASGHELTVTDEYGHKTTNTYDDAGNQIKTLHPGGGTETWTYSEDGSVLTHTDPVGNTANATEADRAAHTIHYDYDAVGRQIATRTPDPVSPGRYLTTRTVYDAAGHAIETIDASGASTKMEYDALGRITAITDPAGGTQTTTFDAAGRTRTEASAGSSVSYDYDAAGNITRATTGAGRVTTFTYDINGRLGSQTSARGNVTGADAADYTTNFTYDEAGNQTRLTDPLGHTSAAEFNAENITTKATDAAGYSISYALDSAGNVSKVTDRNGGISRYTYNKIGQLVSRTNPNGGETSYTYNSSGTLASATTPGGQTTSYTYNANGQLQKTDLPDGSISLSTDALGRTNKIDYSDTTPDITTTYTGAGRVGTVSNGDSRSTYRYDTAGRVTAIERGSSVTSYTWDNASRLTKRALPDGRTQGYTWGDDGLLTTTTLTASGQDQSVAYAYDADNELLSATRSNGPATTYEWDKVGRLTSIKTTQGTTTLLDQTVDRNANGAPERVMTSQGGSTKAVLYVYDAGGRVASVCSPTSGTTCNSSAAKVAYSYDANSNRTSLNDATGTTASSYDADDRLIKATSTAASVGTITYTYGANGDLESQSSPAGIQTFTYGLDGNLYNTKLADGTAVDYGYDEAGNRTLRKVNGASNATWAWDTVAPQPFRITETGSSTHRWFDDPQSNLGTATADVSSSGIPTWLLGDFQNSIIGTAKTAGLTGTAKYGAFGEPLTSTGSATTAGLGFQGQYRDAVTGLYDMRARDYDPSKGAFTASDAVDDAVGTPIGSGYGFVDGMSTTLSDPSGNCPICVIGLIGATVGAGVGAYTNWQNCDHAHKDCTGEIWTGAGLGAAAGLADGLTMGRGSSLIGGLYNWANNAAIASQRGQKYSAGDAARDFTYGFVGGAVARGASQLAAKGIGKAFGARAASAAQRAAVVEAKKSAAWVEANKSTPYVGNPADIACSTPRLARDANVNAKAPDALDLDRKISRTPAQEIALQDDIAEVYSQGATDIRVNQQQVDVTGKRVGINRPDLQYTLNGKRYYVEYDRSSSTRGPLHEQRIKANDPLGYVRLEQVG